MTNQRRSRVSLAVHAAALIVAALLVVDVVRTLPGSGLSAVLGRATGVDLVGPLTAGEETARVALAIDGPDARAATLVGASGFEPAIPVEPDAAEGARIVVALSETKFNDPGVWSERRHWTRYDASLEGAGAPFGQRTVSRADTRRALVVAEAAGWPSGGLPASVRQELIAEGGLYRPAVRRSGGGARDALTAAGLLAMLAYAHWIIGRALRARRRRPRHDADDPDGATRPGDARRRRSRRRVRAAALHIATIGACVWLVVDIHRVLPGSGVMDAMEDLLGGPVIFVSGGAAYQNHPPEAPPGMATVDLAVGDDCALVAWLVDAWPEDIELEQAPPGVGPPVVRVEITWQANGGWRPERLWAWTTVDWDVDFDERDLRERGAGWAACDQSEERVREAAYRHAASLIRAVPELAPDEDFGWNIRGPEHARVLGYLHNAATVLALLFLVVRVPWMLVASVRSRAVARRRTARGLCPRCAYDLAGLPADAARCPECGARRARGPKRA